VSPLGHDANRCKVLSLGKIVKDSVERKGMIGWQYNTIGVSDGITMGGEGKLTSFVCEQLAYLWRSFRHAILTADA
jgi:dihydroxyacid dehydratase/phosphogluconate dehydratase